VRLVVNVIAIALIGLVVGGLSAWYSIQRNHGLGGIESGPWTAWPFAGGADADPYTMAKVSRDGTIPLGATEGLAFEASTDNENRELDRECDYIISGVTPPSKLWTLAAYSETGEPVKPATGGKPAMQSGKLLRFADGSFRIAASQMPRAGNWLGISGEGKFYLVLRVYDTPVTGTSGIVSPVMPNIIREGCKE